MSVHPACGMPQAAGCLDCDGGWALLLSVRIVLLLSALCRRCEAWPRHSSKRHHCLLGHFCRKACEANANFAAMLYRIVGPVLLSPFRRILAPPTRSFVTACVHEDLPTRLTSHRGRAREASRVFAELNAIAFDGTLPNDTRLIWNPRLRMTAGRCRFLLLKGTRTAEIELSPRVLDTPARLRETMAHEMCHAAQWVLDGADKPPHGPVFQQWARRVEEHVPDLHVTTRHSYKVFCRHRYSCTACEQMYGRHSRSIDLRTRRCGRCGAKLRYDGIMQRDGTLIAPAAREEGLRTPQPAFASFVADEYGRLRKRWPRVSHKRIMQELSKKWKRRKEKARGAQ